MKLVSILLLMALATNAFAHPCPEVKRRPPLRKATEVVKPCKKAKHTWVVPVVAAGAGILIGTTLCRERQPVIYVAPEQPKKPCQK